MSGPEEREQWREAAERHRNSLARTLMNGQTWAPRILALLADLEAAEQERDAWRESAADLGQRLNKAEYDRDEEQYENQRLRDGIKALADEWRYKGEFGWGPWQEGHGPDIEGQVLDEAAIRLRALLAEGGA
jgi:hypothetical protein